MVIARTKNPIAPDDVARVEQLLKKELARSLKVIFDITPAQLIESNR